ncbi:MAG TPA: phosphoglucosamine mutase, partial [Ginsengibacter sp.]|nr:phosphoglucosamine mutase [Ginsengibacter sp.]
FASVDQLGKYTSDSSYLQKHIEAILNYPLVDKEAIAAKNFNIVVDGINSSGALYVPELLKALGVANIYVINEDITGNFAHNPEPLPQHLTELSKEVVSRKAHLGIAVDPDVDRLCFVNEDGKLFGEEYTLVAVADYILSQRKGNTVSNMSSTKSLKELTLSKGGTYYPSAVGEVNVVKKMKEVKAVIGGEGNGGIIVPDFHYGRDALIGIGLFLTHLARTGKSMSQLRAQYPDYYISKNKAELNPATNVKVLLSKLTEKYKNNPVNTEDGLKIEFGDDWVHVRASNTEPILRIYSESSFQTTAENIANRIIRDIHEISTQ